VEVSELKVTRKVLIEGGVYLCKEVTEDGVDQREDCAFLK
jgi:hypothetical protein